MLNDIMFFFRKDIEPGSVEVPLVGLNGHIHNETNPSQETSRILGAYFWPILNYLKPKAKCILVFTILIVLGLLTIGIFRHFGFIGNNTSKGEGTLYTAIFSPRETTGSFSVLFM